MSFRHALSRHFTTQLGLRSRQRLLAVLLSGLCLSLVACGGDSEIAPTSTTGQAGASHAVPQDANLASIYQQSCQACHTVVQTGAPQTGVVADWTPRLKAKGIEGLVETTITGFQGMPPMGSCPDCSYEDFEALIQFMARQH